MDDRSPRVILDMTPDGDFRATPRSAERPASTWPLKLGLGAAVVSAGAIAIVAAALFLWLASVLIPIAIVAGLVAYIAFRIQVFRAVRRHRAASGRTVYRR